MKKIVENREKELAGLEEKLKEAKARLDATDGSIKTDVRTRIEPEERKVADAEDELKKVAGTFDRWARNFVQKEWGAGDVFRSLPILDAFESPTKIKQIWLPDLTIDYSFKEVPRFPMRATHGKRS